MPDAAIICAKARAAVAPRAGFSLPKAERVGKMFGPNLGPNFGNFARLKAHAF